MLMSDVSNSYWSYLCSFYVGSEDVLSSIFPEKVYTEYQKLIVLLKEYNHLVSLLNFYQKFNPTIDDITKSRVMLKKKASVLSEQTDIVASHEQVLEQWLQKIKDFVPDISVDNLSNVYLLSQMVEKLKSGMIILDDEKHQLSNFKNDQTTECKLDQALDTYFSNENQINENLQKIEHVITQISEQIEFLESFVDSDGKQRIDSIEVRANHKQHLADNLRKNKAFLNLPSEFVDGAVSSYIELFCSYLELRKTVFSQTLPIARSVVNDYKTRPGQLSEVSFGFDMNLDSKIE